MSPTLSGRQRVSALVAALVLLAGGVAAGVTFTTASADDQGGGARTVATTVPTTPTVGNDMGTKRGNTRTFRITAQQFTQQIANFPIKTATVYGFSADGRGPSTPGPTLVAYAGERIQLVVTNKLNQPTTVHPHGTHEPNSADGVAGISTKPIAPGETRTYPAYTPGHAGTFAYHTHDRIATQEPRGLAGLIVILPRKVRASQNPAEDFAMTLQQFAPPSEGALVNPSPESGQFPFSTINGKTGDASGGPLVVKRGDLVQLRIYNASPKTHSMHLHGMDMKLVAINGHPLPAPQTLTTKAISPGEFFTLQFRADNPGNWIFHCSFAADQANKGMSGYLGAPVGMTRVIHYQGYQPVPPQYFSYPG